MSDFATCSKITQKYGCAANLTQDYMQALKEDAGTRYTTDQIMREVMEDE
ncbi:hypothetical protein [Mobiluncus mulieris]|nr:hypothetical protein [Mobiluncus mulieris]